MKKTFFLLSILIFLSYISLASIFTDGDYFNYAKSKISQYNPQRKDYVIIVDYRKNIFSERLYVLDMKTEKIVISSRVSHAWKSGVLTPTDYSNVRGSNKSSKGNFITLGTTYGKFGYSMLIRGLDQGINDNVLSRSVIFHSTKKMNNPWSNGCFATSDDVNKEIIDLTKNGVLVCVID